MKLAFIVKKTSIHSQKVWRLKNEENEFGTGVKPDPGYTWWWCWWYATAAPVSSYLETHIYGAAAKFERKQFGGNSIANRSPPVKIGKQARRPIRPNSRAARSWSGQSCFRRKTYLVKQFRFVKGSEDNVTKCRFPRIFKLRRAGFGQPAVPEKFWTRIVLWTDSPCNRSSLLLCGTLRWRQSFDVCMASKGLLWQLVFSAAVRTYETYVQHSLKRWGHGNRSNAEHSRRKPHYFQTWRNSSSNTDI